MTNRQSMFRPTAKRREPFLNAPTVVTGLITAMIFVHVLRSLLPDAQQWQFITSFGVIPVDFLNALKAGLVWRPGPLVVVFGPLVSYAFLHGDLLHLGFNSLWLLALGSPVARRTGAARYLGFFIVTAVLAVLFYVLLRPTSEMPVIGASGSISGLMGALARLLFVKRRRDGSTQSVAAINDTRLLVFAGSWIALNLVFGLGGIGFVHDSAQIAWEAHVGGFIAGLVVFPLFDRAPR